MAVASFEDLCAGFCEIVKVPPPELKADEQGLIAFHVVVRGTTINMIHCPERSEDHLFVIFELGPLGQEGPAGFAELQALLNANYVLLQVNPPVFSRNAATGEVVLQYVYPLFDATPSSLHELIDEGVDWILDWRENLASGEPDAGFEQAHQASPIAMLNLA